MKICLSITIRNGLVLIGLGSILAGILMGCSKHGSRTAKFGSNGDMVGYGVYSAQKLDNAGLSNKLSLNQGNTYSEKKFQGTCLLVENKGDWKADHESLELHLTEIRQRTDCATEDWQVQKVSIKNMRILRNVTPNSFDLLNQDEDVSAQWVRFSKHQ